MKLLRFFTAILLPSLLTGCVTRTIVKLQEQVPPASKSSAKSD